jgi:uncharacterized protein YfaS (alpha-2-macroglobulin family)
MVQKVIRGLVCVAAVAGLAVSVTHCKKQARTGQEGAVKPVSIIGDLRVLHASPQGPTTAAHMTERLVAIFDHPMVPLQEIPEGQGSSFLRVEPSVPGKFRWMGTRTLTFTPSARFPYGTEVKVTIPAGTVSLDGYSLKQDHSWSFSTITPELVSHIPSDDGRWVRLDDAIRLVFNQPVDEGRAQPFLALTEISPEGQTAGLDFSLGRLSAKEVKEEKLEAETENILVLKPSQRLRPDYSYNVLAKAGLPGQDGPLGLKQNSDFKFETFKSFRLEGIEPKEAFNPYESLKIQFTNQVSYKDLASKIRFKPEVKIPDYYLEWDSANDLVWLNLPFAPETDYVLTIPADLQDEFGNTLGRDAQFNFKTTSYTPTIRMTTGHGVIEAYAQTLYSFQALNVEQAGFQGGEVSPDKVVPLLSAEKAFWSSENFVPYQGFYSVDKKLDFKVPRNKKQLIPLDLREVLKGDHGLVFIQLDTQSKDKWDRYPKAFLQVTELGLTGKFSADSNVIWVTELRTGNPVPEADVEIRDATNRVCWRGRTDADGRAACPGWKGLGIRSKESWEKPEQYVFASRKDDVAFISSSWGTGVEPYRFGIQYNWESEPESLRGYVFTERGIYRAGETVHIKGIVRRQVKGQWRLPSAKQASCEVFDSLQKSVYKGAVGLDAFGCFSFDLTTAPAAALGYYQITAKIPSETGGSPEVLSGSFRVEAFRPAEFEVHLRSLQDSYTFGQDYQAEIRASYLFGGAMAAQKARWSLRLNPTNFAPPAPKGFQFGNKIDWQEAYSDEGEMRGSENSRLIGSGEALLNNQGLLSARTPLVAEKETDSVTATLEATVQSPSRKSISNRIQTVVHRGEYYIGLKPETTFLKKGSRLNVEVLAARPDGQRVEKSINVKLIKREWRSVRKAGSGGRFEWLTEKEDTELKSQRVATKNSPVAVVFTPDKSGFYILLAEAADARKNRITTSTFLYVTGEDYVAWDRRNDDMIELVPDSDTYRPGEKARIMVKSPYERAKALVTVERESVLESRVVEIQGSTGQVEVPIISDYIPNVFVSVLLVQGRTEAARPGQSDDVGKPSFKIGYAQLAVNPEERKLKVEIKPDQDRYKPRDQVSLKLHVANQKNNGRRSSVALAVVDVGVLNLIGYTTPDPFSWFFGPKPLSVDTADGRINIVGQRAFGEKGENAGGGGEEAPSPGMTLAEVELRGNFKTTAYWNPSIVTDDKGDASVTFTLPDNLTTFRVMAVALTPDSLFGNSETTFRVAKPLLLQASLPRFARVGDAFQAGVVVHNFSPQKGSVTLSGAFKGITPQDKQLQKTLSLEAGASQEILYGVKAEKAGLATFSFRAMMGSDSDGLEISLPVEQPRSLETVALFGETTQYAEEKVVIPELYPSDSRLDLQASATALSGLKECLDYLTDYPYLCLEQRLSSILPYILAPDVIRDFKLSRMAPKEWEEFVRRTLDRIYEFQKDSGGFGVWQDSRYESPYLTCYAVFGLLKARQAGYEVKTDALNRGIQFLKALLREKNGLKKYPYGLKGYTTTLAFALYDLALADQPEPGYASRMFADRKNLTVFGKAMLLKALHLGQGSSLDRQTLIQELANSVKVTASEAHFEDEEGRADSWIFSSNLRTTATILQSLLEVGSDDPLLPGVARYIVQKQKAGRWSSTQENIYAFYALNTFYKTHEKIRPDFTVEMSLAKKLILKEEFRGPTAEIKTAATGLAAFKPGQPVSLTVSKKGEGLVYYGARLRYVARKPLDPRDEGLAVYKKFETLDGKPLDTIRGGDVVAVILEIAVPQDSLFVVVADPLPGGFEAVNTTLETESSEDALALEESQPSQAWWYEGFNHVEMHDNRVLLFADSLAPGVHTYRYLARALTYGEFVLPGTKVEQMYAPEVFGRSAERVIIIKK